MKEIDISETMDDLLQDIEDNLFEQIESLYFGSTKLSDFYQKVSILLDFPNDTDDALL